MKTYPIRLKPGQDLKQELDALTNREQWAAACVLAAVGSLTEVAIRYANQEKTELLSGHFEIVSLSGTLSQDGSHLHIAVSDKAGKVVGGHLKEGAIVYTTVELVIGILDDWEFTRENCPQSGYLELVVGKS